jgi:hypothetical protein
VATPPTPAPSQTPAITATIPPSELTITNLERWKNPQTPSAKLVALVNMLKTWEYNTESAMDKVIIYSQCRDVQLLAPQKYSSTTPSSPFRDFNA